jgi:hypothetical protein
MNTIHCSSRFFLTALPFRGAILISLLALGGGAQAQLPPPPAVVSAAAQQTPEEALARTKSQLAASQERETVLREEVVALDAQIDARVDELVSLLKGVQDSTESKTEVMNTKKEAIEGLKKWVQLYAQERGQRLGQLRRGGTAETEADLEQQVANIEGEINDRVQDIVELAASMSTREELTKYDYYQTEYTVIAHERDEYKAANRQASLANQAQDGVQAELEKAIAGLERDIALVPQRLPRDQQAAELARLQALLDERRQNLRELSTASPSDGRPVGDREANQLDRDLQFAKEDIRALWAQLQAKAGELGVERRRGNQLVSRIRLLERDIAAPAP